MARGAARANQQQADLAICDFEKALGEFNLPAHYSACCLGAADPNKAAWHAEINPEHSNAAKYLAAVRPRASARVEPAPVSLPAATPGSTLQESSRGCPSRSIDQPENAQPIGGGRNALDFVLLRGEPASCRWLILKMW